MKYLGIDYGRKKIGLSISEGMIAEPLKVIRFEKKEDVLEKVKRVVKAESADVVVVGMSEGEMGGETKEFAKILGERISSEIKFQDETLTTQTAQELSINASIKRKKRKTLEDAYSATIILQNYLDNI